MASEKGDETDPLKIAVTVEDILEESLGLASSDFDPLRVIYAPSLETVKEGVEVYKSVSQFMEDVKLETDEEPSGSGLSGASVCPQSSFPTMSKQDDNVEVNENVPEFMEQDDVKIEDEDPSHPCDVTAYPRNSFSTTNTPETSNFTTQKQGHDSKDIKGNIAGLSTKESTESVTDRNIDDEFVTKSKMATQPAHPGVRIADDSKKESEINAKSRQLSVKILEPEAESESTNKLSTSLQSCRRRSARRTVLTQMDCGFQEGPLSILKRSVQEKMKVRVWTRSVRNIRGVSTGYVVAFDKHFNLAMIDVDEVYRKPLGKHQRKRKKPKDTSAPPAKSAEVSEDTEALYPNIPWQPVHRHKDTAVRGMSVSPHTLVSDSNAEDHNSSGEEHEHLPADGIGDLTSKFRGMHVFEENDATRLLGVKSRKLLTRHLNQVLLRGDHVVAVSLVEMGL
ncbi:uncharacterized protein LOC143291879 [Babylonia areolata]|uniref:uncharacterized protein LOC143291879 n=1 Tax=Babylonia areolata TaxID=304850 RepID=UPI003FD5CC64